MASGDQTHTIQELERRVAELTTTNEGLLASFVRAVDMRERESEGHTQRVADITVRFARSLGYPEPEVAQMRYGALFHDVGKMGISEMILLKRGALTEEEWVVMQQHPRLGYQLLTPISHLPAAMTIVLYHHEKWDGSGYPDHLRQAGIPRPARLFALVDVWDALSSDRPFRDGWPAAKVREYIELSAGTHFDPELAAAFLEQNNWRYITSSLPRGGDPS